MAASDARPVPRKNAAFRFYFAIRKNDGTLITTWAGQDSEVSLDGVAFSDCTSEATEIGTSGCGYIDLTAAEMNADCVVLKITVTNTDALPLVFTFFPEEAGDYRADTVMISGDSVAADNLEAAADGTGYNLGGGLVVSASVTAGVTVTTNNDKSGYSLTSGTGLGNQTANITGNLSGSVGSVTGNVGGNVVGSVASVVGGVTVTTNNDKTGYSLATAPLDAAGTRAALGLASANLDTQLAAIVADTGELQTDWANGGRLDLILDTIDLWTKRSAVLNTGTLTGAGTNTEVYTISALGITATCTTDSSGNRLEIVWS